MKGAATPRSGQDPTLFGASATILSIAAVYCYFAGYIFSYFFYSQGFGVTLESLDLSPQFYFMRAYNSLKSPGGVALVVVLMLITFAYLGRRLRGGIMLLAMLAAFPVLFAVSRATAQHETILRYCNPTGRVQFAFNDDLLREPSGNPASASADAGAKTTVGVRSKEAATASTAAPAPPAPTPAVLKVNAKTPQELQALSEAGRLALLLETKDRIIVFSIPNCYPLGPQGPRMVPAAHVYTLLRSDLKFTNVTP